MGAPVRGIRSADGARVTLPAHVELELLADDHAQAVRRVESLERAPFEGRVADQGEYERTLHFARQRVGDLARELRATRAEMEDGA